MATNAGLSAHQMTSRKTLSHSLKEGTALENQGRMQEATYVLNPKYAFPAQLRVRLAGRGNRWGNGGVLWLRLGDRAARSVACPAVLKTLDLGTRVVSVVVVLLVSQAFAARCRH